MLRHVSGKIRSLVYVVPCTESEEEIYICLSVIKNIEKRKGAHGSVFMRMKDHGMV